MGLVGGRWRYHPCLGERRRRRRRRRRTVVEEGVQRVLRLSSEEADQIVLLDSGVPLHCFCLGQNPRCINRIHTDHFNQSPLVPKPPAR